MARYPAFIVSYWLPRTWLSKTESLSRTTASCHADYIANQPFDTIFSDAATQGYSASWVQIVEVL